MKKLLTKTLSIIFSALLILPLFTAWSVGTSSGGLGGTQSKAYGMNEKVLGELFYVGSDSESLMTISRILYFVVLGFAALLIVLLVAQLIMKKAEKLNNIVKVVSIVLLVLAIVSFGLNLTWGLVNSTSRNLGSYTYKLTFLPGFGGYALLVSGLLASVFGLMSTCGKKRK